MVTWILICIGIVFWYFTFGSSSVVRTGGHGGLLMPFIVFWEDLTSGFSALGVFHAIGMHVILPFGPAIVSLFLK